MQKEKLTKKDLTKMIKVFEVEYGKTFSNERIDLWFETFKDIEKDRLQKAITETLYTSRFFPTISDVYQLLKPKYRTV